MGIDAEPLESLVPSQVDLRHPYPFFARQRRERGVFEGTVMDYSKTPESFRPKSEFSAVSFNAVNTVFRNNRVFTSKLYDKTIGLFMGPTILAMTKLEGVTNPARAMISVCVGSANRDKHRWGHSEEFDIFRKALPHISFAAGEHTCLGLHLARLETRVAVECPLNRLTDIELVTDDDPHIHGQPFRSPTAMPVTFEAAEGRH